MTVFEWIVVLWMLAIIAFLFVFFLVLREGVREGVYELARIRGVLMAMIDAQSKDKPN